MTTAHIYAGQTELDVISGCVERGLTFSEIASITGKTRSAVAGMVRRHGLAAKRPPNHDYTARQCGQINQQSTRQKDASERAKKRARDRATLKEQAAQMASASLIGPLTCEAIPDDHCCRWIENNAFGQAQWCGQPVKHGIGRSFERSYCAAHLIRMINIEVKTPEEKAAVDQELRAIVGGMKFGRAGR